MTLIEKMARNLCSKLWGDPDIMVIQMGVNPIYGPDGSLVIPIGMEPMPAWNAYIRAAYGALHDIVSESPEIADAIQPHLDEEAKRELATQAQSSMEEAEQEIIHDWRSRHGLN